MSLVHDGWMDGGCAGSAEVLVEPISRTRFRREDHTGRLISIDSGIGYLSDLLSNSVFMGVPGARAYVVDRGMAEHLVSGGTLVAVGAGSGGSSTPLPLSTGYTLTAADDGKRYYCTTALTVTIPENLATEPEVVILPPASGNLTIAVTGTATLNGAALPLTRTRAGNPVGVVISPHTGQTNAYGVS